MSKGFLQIVLFAVVRYAPFAEQETKFQFRPVSQFACLAREKDTLRERPRR
jgi:hypothetical protein